MCLQGFTVIGLIHNNQYSVISNDSIISSDGIYGSDCECGHRFSNLTGQHIDKLVLSISQAQLVLLLLFVSVAKSNTTKSFVVQCGQMMSCMYKQVCLEHTDTLADSGNLKASVCFKFLKQPLKPPPPNLSDFGTEGLDIFF